MDELLVNVFYQHNTLHLYFQESVTISPDTPYRLRFDETAEVKNIPPEIGWLLYVPVLISVKYGRFTLDYYQAPGAPSLHEFSQRILAEMREAR